MGCEGKIPFGIPSHRWTDNINMNIEAVFEDVD
jgi:hypothetical protein